MNTLVFSIAWTGLFAIAVIASWFDPAFQSEPLWFRITFSACPLAGALFISDSLRKLRRHRSVRLVRDDGQEWFVWTDLNGLKMRSLEDPRPEWDAGDKDFADK